MLTGIDRILTGTLLAYLDAMGHSDAVVVADAHFPAARLGQRTIEMPALTAPAVLRAIRSVIPLDDLPALELMEAPAGQQLGVQEELMAAAGVSAAGTRILGRAAFYEHAAEAFVIVRTGETRTYGNALLRKGVVGQADS